MIQMLFAVPVIMSCALAGTVGMIKAIQKFFPHQFQNNSTKEETE